MNERLSELARRVMQLANQEAQRFNHEYIGTEHVLLGLLKLGEGAGCRVLVHLEQDLRKVRLEVEKLLQSGPDMVTMGKLPPTPQAKKVCEFAEEESRNRKSAEVTTLDLLCGLIQDGGVAAGVLGELGVSLDDVRKLAPQFSDETPDELRVEMLGKLRGQIRKDEITTEGLAALDGLRELLGVESRTEAIGAALRSLRRLKELFPGINLR